MVHTSVTPAGTFRVGVHKPFYEVVNLRHGDAVGALGRLADGTEVDNRRNFPEHDVREESARWIYEIANAFAFRGTTYIDSAWALARAQDPASIRIRPRPDCSLLQLLGNHLDLDQARKVFAELPRPLRYDLAANSTDPEELVLLARSCCRMVMGEDGHPMGLLYRQDENGCLRAEIDDFELFETIANNPFLPDTYKEVMVLRPGVQGASEIVGDWKKDGTHVFEYLRRNSYIPWGHFAANMANDSIRYATADLSPGDMRGLRHLYYQRIYVTLAAQLGLEIPVRRRSLREQELEELRVRILQAAAAPDARLHTATLWGWNFGYDFSGSGCRLHASHQMIHQQYAMVPAKVGLTDGGTMDSYSCGDLVADTVRGYREEHGRDFFTDFLAAIRGNRRTDGGEGESSLVVWEDDNVLLFVPKAQVSQWELQLMVIADSDQGPVGNVIEADSGVRASIDSGILMAQHVLAGLGARMVSSIEYPRRLGLDNGQRLLYSFLPKLPWSMGAFSEAQLRFISSHFPEDFAIACRGVLAGGQLGKTNGQSSREGLPLK
ncbi:hypothetical protein ACLG6S_12830 [Thermodesulfobacteriota bacterium B35]